MRLVSLIWLTSISLEGGFMKPFISRDVAKRVSEGFILLERNKANSINKLK